MSRLESTFNFMSKYSKFRIMKCYNDRRLWSTFNHGKCKAKQTGHLEKLDQNIEITLHIRRKNNKTRERRCLARRRKRKSNDERLVADR